MYLTEKASKRRLKVAENARSNRLEIVKALSHGQIHRRELIKWGLVGACGLLMPIRGLSPFVGSTRADAGSDGDSIQPGDERAGVHAADAPHGGPAAEAGFEPGSCADGGVQRQVAAGPGGSRWRPWPDRGAPAGAGLVAPAVGHDAAEGCHRGHAGGGPDQPERGHSLQVPPEPADAGPELGVDVQRDDSAEARSGPVRRADSLPPPQQAPGGRPKNGGFGRHTISTHEHNGHHGAENDGFTGAYFFPGQFYDYHWPIVLAGHYSINTDATDPQAGTPDDSGGLDQGPGRLARDDEHALVPRPHVQLHVAERVQGQRRDVQHLQRPGPRQRGDQRRRQPAAARAARRRTGATWTTT